MFAERPALHRYPKSMAARVQALCRLIVDRYDGDAGRVWGDAADGTDLRRRVAEMPGFGAQKAQIFVALLGKQLGVRPAGGRRPGRSVTRERTARSRTSATRTPSPESGPKAAAQGGGQRGGGENRASQDRASQDRASQNLPARTAKAR